MTTLSTAALDRALTAILAEGDTDLFPTPVDYRAIKHDWPRVQAYLASCSLEDWRARPHRVALTPKGRFGFRVGTQLDPLDSIVYTALLVELGASIEAVRQPEDVVFSYRFESAPGGRLYRRDPNYSTFRRASLQKADALGDGYVVMTDIADFYPRLYLHRIENELAALNVPTGFQRTAARLIKNWNLRVSYGIPVGPPASRLLAELTLRDIDLLLRAHGYEFIRYSDDFRVFVPDRERAHAVLAFLAEALHENHGHTLQESKTQILAARDFVRRFSRDEADQEDSELVAGFEQLATKLGLSDYDLPALEDLDAEDIERVESLNVMEMLKSRLAGKTTLDLGMARFLLKRMADLGLQDEDDVVASALDDLTPVFQEAVTALKSQSGLDTATRQKLAGDLLALLERDAFATLDYYAAWILRVFAEDMEWNHRDALVRLAAKYVEGIAHTELMGALAHQGGGDWFRQQRRRFPSMSPWARRAFLAGAHCLHRDEREAWLGSIKADLDPLELAISTWVKDGRP